MTAAKLRLLIVDDEQQVLDALCRTLRGSFDVTTATSGGAGLAALAMDPSIAIVSSDMRMPVMSGAAFLARVREGYPNTVRILLTGQADLDDAIAAINEGNIFRFLRKPCLPAAMAAALAAASEQHRLIHAEKELLERTLHGSVQALSDTLALANPALFGVATRVKRLATRLAETVGLKDVWALEIAALVCQLGAVSVPSSVFERQARNDALTLAEREMLDAVPALSLRLIAHIPRLEPVREIVLQSRISFTAAGGSQASGIRVPTAACILRIALDFEERCAGGDSRPMALSRLRKQSTIYDPLALDALASMCHAEDEPTVDLPISALRNGMVVASDIRTKSGVLLVARGHEVTLGLLSRLHNFGPELGSHIVRVDAPRHRPVPV